MTHQVNKNNKTSKGFTPVSNTIADKDLKHLLTKSELLIFGTIVDYNQRYHERTRKMTVSFFMEKCRCSRRTVYKSLRALQNLGLIEKYGDYIVLLDFHGEDKSKPAALKKVNAQKQKKYYNKNKAEKQDSKEDSPIPEEELVRTIAPISVVHPYIKKENISNKKEKQEKEKRGDTPPAPRISFSKIQLEEKDQIPRKPRVKGSDEQYKAAVEMVNLFISLTMLSFSTDQFRRQVSVVIRLMTQSGYSPIYIKRALEWGARQKNDWYRKITSRNGTRTYRQMCKLMQDFMPIYLEQKNRKWFNDKYKRGKFSYDGKNWIKGRKVSVEVNCLGKMLDEVIPFKSPSFIDEVERWDRRFKENYERECKSKTEDKKFSIQEDLLAKFLAAGGAITNSV